MPQSRVARQSADIILKRIAVAFGGDLFARFGLSLPPIVAALPSELPQLTVSTQFTDLLFRLADGSILHLEFQTQHRADTLLRFATYNLAAVARYGGPIYTVVLYGAGIRSAPVTLDIGSIVFTVRNILVGQEDGDAVLRRLHETAARGEPFTASDRIDLILSPLMRQRRALDDVVPELARLTQRLPDAQRESTIGALLGLSYHDVSDEVVAAILRELNMANSLQAFVEETFTRGLDEGRAEGQRQALRVLLRARFGALPQALEQRIATSDEGALNALIERAANAASLDAL